MQAPILLTGATGAVGGACAHALARAGGHDLILLGRPGPKSDALLVSLRSLAPARQIEAVPADLASQASLRSAIAQVRSLAPHLHAVIHIAAVFTPRRTLTPEGIEMMWAVNHLAPWILTNGLLDRLGEGSRVITVSAPSSVRIQEPGAPFSALGAFGASKMGNHLFSYALARRVADTGVQVMVFHPGLVKSELLAGMPKLVHGFFNLMSKPPEAAGSQLAALALDAKYSQAGGRFWNVKGRELPKPGYSADEAAQEQCWQLSAQQAGA